MLLGVISLRYSEIGVLAAVGWRPPVYNEQPALQTVSASKSSEASVPVPVDWTGQLEPRGSETRLGDALRYLIDKERGGPAAGIAVFTDGASNAGTEEF